MAVRTYAQILGVVLILTGILGLVLGERLLLGILNIDILEDIVHLATGGLLAYVGFARVDDGFAGTVVGVLGVIYLVVGIVGFIVPGMFGLLPDSYTVFDNLLHLALGVLSIAVAWYLQPGPRAARG
ncbi:MAG: hypothetical protein H0U04_03860 [Rubrobacter sp.]|nr:hypothetical protein [Rubrobacter sp.]